jgi:chromosomal replication initiator protein
MMDPYQKVWHACLTTIRKNTSPQSFKTWFEPIKSVKLEGNVLTIMVPSKLHYEWIEEHYLPLLKVCLLREIGEAGRLEYQIVMSKEVQTREKTGANPDQEPKPNFIGGNDIPNVYTIPGIKSVKPDSNLNLNLKFNNFIEGDCNRLGRNAGVAISKKPGNNSFNPFVIYGGVGLGKTHLAQAIGNSILETASELNVIYVSAEKFTNQLIQSIKNNSVSDFTQFYGQVDVLIIDDIQFLSGKQKTQEIFFHLFNNLHNAGKQIIMTSDRAPKDLVDIEDRLISRFKWGLSADLQTPDLETRMAIVEQKLQESGLQVSQDIIELIAFNIKNNVRELYGLANSLKAQHTINHKEITTELVKEILRGFITTQAKEITVGLIQSIVAEHFNVSMDKLVSASRRRTFVEARQIAMYLTKELTKLPLKNIGENFGGRDHSTVIYSCTSVQNLMDTDDSVKTHVQDIMKKLQLTASSPS